MDLCIESCTGAYLSRRGHLIYAPHLRIIAPMQTPISKILLRLMASSGVSQTELHRRTGVGQSTLSRILNPHAPKGIKDPTDKQVKPLADFFGITTDQLRGHSPLSSDPDAGTDSNVEPGPPITTAPRKVNIVGTAQLGPDGYWESVDAGTDGWVETWTRDPDAYALRLKGDSMSPAIRSGWISVCEPNHRLVPEEYVMIKLKTGQSMVKELLFDRCDEVVLMSVNGNARTTIAWADIEKAHYVGAILPPSKVLGTL